MKDLISVGEIKNTYVYDRKDYVNNVRRNIYIKDKREYVKKNHKYIQIYDLEKNLILAEKWAEKPCKQDCLLLHKICNLKTKRCKNPPPIKKSKK